MKLEAQYDRLSMPARCADGLSETIRVARAADVRLLEADFSEGGMEKHDDRLVRQACGDLVYLIAWRDDRPVGHALLKWGGSEDPIVAAQLDGPCPEVEDLFVAADVRGQGIGTQLLHAAEQRVCAQGGSRIGLSVGVIPPSPARRLYEHLGYRDAGFGEHMEQGAYKDPEGEIRLWQEMCIYLIKDLK